MILFCSVRRLFSLVWAFFVLAVLGLFPVTGVLAGPEQPKSQPLAPVQAEPLLKGENPAKVSGSVEQAGTVAEAQISDFPAFIPDPAAPLVVELFSSQACIFCPRADRLFTDLIKQPGIIGLACHIDYFDVAEGSLSQPFCTARQKYYVDKLGTGPQYTPQMIMQGAVDVVGYRMADITAGLQAATSQTRVPLFIAPHPEQEERFIVTLPKDMRVLPPQSEVWLALFDKDKEVTVAEGRNRGQRMVYSHIVSQLEPLSVWEGGETIVALEGVHENLAGFAVLVHEPKTGHIFAAGQYLFPEPS